MVDSSKKNYSPLPAGKYGRSDNPATVKRHRTNAGKSGIESERIRAHNNLRALKCKKRKKAEGSEEIRDMDSDQRDKWIEDYVERETAAARKRAEEADLAWALEKERLASVSAVDQHPETAESARSFNQMLEDIGESIDDVATSGEEDEDNEDDDDDEEDEEDIEGESDEEEGSGWVPDIVQKSAQRRIDAFREKCMWIEEMTRSGWEDADKYFRERDEKYGVTGKGSSSAQNEDDLPSVESVSPTPLLQQTYSDNEGRTFPVTQLPVRHKRLASIPTDEKPEATLPKRYRSENAVSSPNPISSLE